MREYTRSEAMTQEALQATPGGSQTGSKAPGRAGPLGGYPAFLSHGAGPYVWDVDGHRYLDFVAGLAAVGLGHAHLAVTDAVREALSNGPAMSLPTEAEALASEELCRLTGWAEQARWVKTGSEAAEAAVRVARAYTGRDHVMTVRAGYHSWHSWFQAVKPEHPGVPDAMADLVTGITYGNLEEAEDLLRQERYACVILEAAPITGGGDGEYLQGLVNAARRHGALVVFDEVVWGFRLATAGASEYFGVVPDLATYGKALGNGVPVAALVGRREVMRHASLVSGTFGGDGLGLAAARAVMEVYTQFPVCRHLAQRGAALIAGVEGALPSLRRVQVEVKGFDVHPVFTVTHAGDAVLPMSLLLQELAQRGVLWHHAGANVMWTMAFEQIDAAAQAFEEALRVVDAAAADGAAGLRKALRGEPYAGVTFARQA